MLVDDPQDVSFQFRNESYMHIQSIYTQVVGSQINASEDLGESEMPSITKEDNFIRELLHLTFDET